MTPKELTRVLAYIAAVKWQFAKTMPQNPHEYTMRKWLPELEETFVWFVELIRRVGQVEMWGGRPYTYLDIDGNHYWTMGSPIDETILINRKTLTDPDAPSPTLKTPH
jgi:hypothetical protein